MAVESLSGIAAAQQRVAALQTRAAMLAPRAAAPQPALGDRSFASILDEATTAGGSVRGTARAVAAAGRLQPPPELAAYGNGRIPAGELTPIGIGRHRLWAPAARSFEQLRTAAAADGVSIGVTDSYRSYDEQVELAGRKGLYSQGGLAATPGRSNHGWGMALDLDLDDRAQAWMRANGPRFGFTENVPREPWHWEWTGA